MQILLRCINYKRNYKMNGLQIVIFQQRIYGAIIQTLLAYSK